jgi:predicted O-linked N-acetylglucosamine transferase (SPINDLY family)
LLVPPDKAIIPVPPMPTDALNIDFLLAQAKAGKLPLGALIGHAEKLQPSGHAAEAARLYETWIAHNDTPAKCVALFNFGVLLSAQGDLDRAAAAYRDAWTLNPRLYQARINAGLVEERKHNDVAALQLWLEVSAAAGADPDTLPLATIALNHVGRMQESRRQYAAAEAALTESLRLNPSQPDAIQHWVHLRQKQCAWPVYAPVPGVSVNALLGATSPLAMLAHTDDPAMQWLAAQGFVRRKYALPDVPRPAPRSGPLDGIRIGYLSGDLCTHAVGLLMAELFEAHDRARVRIVAFDFSPEDGTAHRARLRRACDEIVPIRALDDRAAAQAMRDRGIDVLIDLHGLSAGARPGILALRPAPLIGTYLGFIGTTSLPWVDFVVTDRFTLTEAATPYVSEQPLYIDGSMIPLHGEPVTACRFTRADVGLPDDAVVLASFNNVYKFNPEMFACWLGILRRTERAVLWLLDDNVWATAALRAHAVDAGVSPERLVFAPRCAHAEYREKLTLADLYLDTFPYNAGSTARDVLDAGLPMLTLSGRTPVSRMAGSLLTAAGLPELITTSMDDYEDAAVDLAARPDRLAELKRAIQGRADAWQAAPHRLIRSLEDQLLEWVTRTTRTNKV